MSADADLWMSLLSERLLERFGGRVLLIGIQGSRARGEARDDSDIDAVVVLDRLGPDDIVLYRGILDGMPCRDLACGFLSGRSEISSWAPHDLFQFRRDTVALHGSLDDVLPPEGPCDAAMASSSGACAVYHACVHNMVHGRSVDALRQIAKSCRFTLQAAVCARTGAYHRTGEGLREAAGGEAWLLDVPHELESVETWDEACDELSSRIVGWASAMISEFGGSWCEK